MHRVVTLLDVDNTLLDNDHVVADLMRFMDRELGHERQREYWEIFELLRRELGYADYLGALQRYRTKHPRDSNVLTVSSFLINYPFANRLFPESLDVVEPRAHRGHPQSSCRTATWCSSRGRSSDRGCSRASTHQVLIYVHKELELEDVERRYPAERYVMVDDKLWLLHAIKSHWGSRVTTVWPKQGHYVTDPRVKTLAAPDVTIERIGGMLGWTLEDLLAAATSSPRTT